MLNHVFSLQVDLLIVSANVQGENKFQCRNDGEMIQL